MLLRAVGLGISPVFNARLTIASNVNNYNLSSALQSLGWTTAKRARVEVTINSGVTVGSTSTESPAFLVNLKDIDYVTIINNGNIFGAGGAGGTSAASSAGGAGGAGGTALQALSNVRVVNNGVIGGGGGGNGGNGAYARFLYYVASCPNGGNYQAGYFTCGRCWSGYSINQIISQYAATCTPVYDYPAGGDGANGTAGSGVAGSAGITYTYAGGAGGLAGYYYEGQSKITTITAGTVRGRTI